MPYNLNLLAKNSWSIKLKCRFTFRLKQLCGQQQQQQHIIDPWAKLHFSFLAPCNALCVCVCVASAPAPALVFLATLWHRSGLRLTAFTPCCRFGRVAVIVVAVLLPRLLLLLVTALVTGRTCPRLCLRHNNFMHVAAVATAAAAATTTNNRFTHACATDSDFGSACYTCCQSVPPLLPSPPAAADAVLQFML